MNSKPSLTYEDYERAAKYLNVDVNAIIAVSKVESSGSGFLSTGDPKILFEPYWFSQLTNHVYDKDYPLLSSPVRNKKLYGNQLQEHEKLRNAQQLNKSIALQSTSWGKFQIMGFNFKECGFRSIEDMRNSMYISENAHLLAFCNFLKNYRNGICLEYLRVKNWDRFAFYYNGKTYKNNNYDVQLESNYNKLINKLIK